MRKPILIGIPALVCASSCVPAVSPGTANLPHVAAVSPRPVADSRTLLRQLDLEVPVDLAAKPVAAALAVEAAPPFSTAAIAPDDAARAAECLTAAIYYEARSESLDGQRAVAQVVLNRVRDRAFPASICGVVYQGSTRRTGCQFSFTCDGSMLRPREPAAWARAQAVATMALSGSVYLPVGAATYYHANYVLPWWASSLNRIGMVGSHIFYRWQGAMERALSFRQDYAGREPMIGPAMPGEQPIGEVAVHVGGDASGLVTVHRDGVVAEIAGATTDAVAAPAVAPAAPRLLTVSGVRVHRGADPHAALGTEPAETIS
ncbi:Cell Wall Hydrolase [Sphingomonas gellani]|uniref:Cell Wall Hydrolase n=1 Tax=Sphingomonas gellani TaxID=1166340 RepID=A0A1H8H7P0_9SPHN|nr:cell wall hydrolase [Sphingomonas gellani]SEN52312.1 Cell Wall Hydrolase [Sphingomonas gellani]